MATSTIYFTNIFTNKTVTIHDHSDITTANEYTDIVQTQRLSAIQIGAITDDVIELVHFQTHIIFGYSFNQRPILNRDLEFVMFRTHFNTAVILTKKLMFVTFSYEFNQYLTLSKNIIQLALGELFRQCIVLPKNIMYLRITSPLIKNNLTKKIKYLSVYINEGVHAKLLMSKNLVKLYLGHLYEQPVQLPKYLKHFQMWSIKYHDKLILSPNIVSLALGDNPWTQHIVTDNLSFLTNIYFSLDKRSKNWHGCDNLPNGIRVIKHDGFNKKRSDLPNTVIDIINTRCYSRKIYNEQQLSYGARTSFLYHKIIYHTE